MIVLLFIILFTFGTLFGSLRRLGGMSFTVRDTQERAFVPLEASAVQETGYCTDNLGWISDSQALVSGLAYFYSLTGIQPYIYLTDVDYSTDEGIDLYLDLFEDEGHFLFILYGTTGSGGYEEWYVSTIIGDDAADVFEPYWDVFWDIYDEKYADQDLSTEEVLSLTFRETADELSADIATESDAAEAEGGIRGSVTLLLIGIFLVAFVIVAVIVSVILRSRKSSYGDGFYTASQDGNTKEGWYNLNGEYHSYDEEERF